MDLTSITYNYDETYPLFIAAAPQVDGNVLHDLPLFWWEIHVYIRLYMLGTTSSREAPRSRKPLAFEGPQLVDCTSSS